jgi:hypothetical protein
VRSQIPNVRRAEEPLDLEHLVVDGFYWVRLVFPELLNETSPLTHRVLPTGKPPVFPVDHLDKRTSNGLWRVHRRRGLDNYFGLCLVIRRVAESQSVLVMIGSTHPYLVHRWIPFQNHPFLQDQPQISVLASIPEAFNLGNYNTYLCYTHILQAKPVKRWANKPQSPYLGIAHIAPYTTDQQHTIASA